MTYEILDTKEGDGAAIKCLRCGFVSHNLNDVKQKYCGNCHTFHETKKHMNLQYILDENKNPVEEPDTLKWGQWHQSEANRRVGLKEVGDIRVSTVFLGLNMQYGQGAPILFETIVFGGAHDMEQYRYHTWAEATEGHDRVCKEVFND